MSKFQRARLKKLIDQIPDEKLEQTYSVLTDIIGETSDMLDDLCDPEELNELLSKCLDIRNKNNRSKRK
jgi:hypothetical protein